MIGIGYKTETPVFDSYIHKMSERVELDFFRYKGTKDGECNRFINTYLNSIAQYEVFVNTPASLLRQLIEDVERNFPQLKDCRMGTVNKEDTPLYMFLSYHFVEHGYKNGFQENKISYSLPKDELIESVGIDVCPYCNRNFVYTQKSLRKVKIVQAELDHFYSKELFPYLAIAKYNLVPSCSCCNGYGAKFTTDAYKENMVNPYEINNADEYVGFRLRIKNANVTSLDTMTSGLSFKMLAKKPGMQSNIDVLNLEDLYQHHIDYAAELYYKGLIKANHLYRASLKGILRRKGIVLSDNDINRIIVGNYVIEQDYGKRPLAKMMHDVAEDLGLL